MFEWLFGNNIKKLEEEIRKSFDSVKNDMGGLVKWIKHLDKQDKQAFETVESLKSDLSTIKQELADLKLAQEMDSSRVFDKQVLGKRSVSDKQTGVETVYNPVQTGVQAASFYDILKNLTSNERLVIMTLLNNDMKLSYQDLAVLLGKDTTTVRGQINAIKQKSEGLIEEIIEKNGKKRVFVRDEIKEKMRKYAKVRVGKDKNEGKS